MLKVDLSWQAEGLCYRSIAYHAYTVHYTQFTLTGSTIAVSFTYHCHAHALLQELLHNIAAEATGMTY